MGVDVACRGIIIYYETDWEFFSLTIYACGALIKVAVFAGQTVNALRSSVFCVSFLR